MKISRLFLALIVLCTTVTAIAQTLTTVYASPSGLDSNPGTQALPKQSIYGAMDAVRLARAAGTTGQFVVQIAPGTYSFNKVLAIGSSEGGAVGAPLIFRAETKDVYFDGSRSVTGWQRLSGEMYGVVPAVARDKVFMAALPLSGSTMVANTYIDTGTMNKRGYGIQTSQTWSTLVFNGSSMELAKYPNSGWLTVPQDHNGSATSIALADPAPYGWRNTGDVWAYGFYAWNWADSFENVSGFDASTGRMNLATQPGYGIKKGQRFLLVNALEALDAPSEYFIDRVSGALYFYPPLSGQTDAQIIASLDAGAKLTSHDASFVETSSASDVTFENITFQNGRRSAAVVRYGNRIAFKGCTFKRFNTHAVIVVNGYSHLFQSCDFLDLDEAGIVLNGGDRPSLTPSGHLVLNCMFKDYSKLCRARAAVSIWGVGNTVQNCRIEEAPHAGVVLHGNDNLVTRSEFHRLCLQTNDSAAVYIGRNPTYQGNKVVYNRFQDIWTQLSGNYSNFTAGVYMDDMVSNVDVSNNIFKNVQLGIVMGGGRDIKLDNNYFFNNGKSVHFDARGTSWASDFMTRWNVPGMLAEVPYQQNPWASRYPNLPNYLNDDPERPKRDTLTHSVSVGSLDWLLLLDGLTTSSDLSSSPAIYAANNSVTLADPGFVDMANENFNFTSSSALHSLGIKPIDTTLIGLYADQYRAIGSSNTLPPPEPAPDVDKVAPSTPTGLRTVSGPSTGQVSLSWTSSTDNSGTVVRYDVYRSNRATSGFSFIASSAKASYVDSAGRGKTRYYYVIAVDAAGNRSTASAIVSGIGKK